MPSPDIREAPAMAAWRETYTDDQFLAEMRDRASDAVPVNTTRGRYEAIIPTSRAEFQRLLLIIQELQNPLLPITPPPPGLQGGAIGMEPSAVDAPAPRVRKADEFTPAELRKMIRDFVKAGYARGLESTSPGLATIISLAMDQFTLHISEREFFLVAGDLIEPERV